MVVALSQNLVLHSRIKHMKLDIFFVREKVLDRSLIITHIPISDQVVDIVIKPYLKSGFVIYVMFLQE